jgi:hypothetical protein
MSFPSKIGMAPLSAVKLEGMGKFHHKANKLAKSSKFLSPPQADGVLRNFAPSGTDFAKAWNPRSKLRGILHE